jgi:hypothetical protein
MEAVGLKDQEGEADPRSWELVCWFESVGLRQSGAGLRRSCKHGLDR